jgi:NAD/NADP transhydrogenase alpha subunit
VLANDVRDAAREQVESMGAQFIAVDAQGIAGFPDSVELGGSAGSCLVWVYLWSVY